MPVPFQSYPKVMKHPEYAPAVIEREPGPDKGLYKAGARQVSPARFPDVTVHNVEDEKSYAARGYRPANMGDPAEYERTILEGTVHTDVALAAYPKWKYHDSEMPKVVNDKAEENALGDGWRDTPDAMVEEIVHAFEAVAANQKIDRRKKEHRQSRPKA